MDDDLAVFAHHHYSLLLSPLTKVHPYRACLLGSGLRPIQILRRSFFSLFCTGLRDTLQQVHHGCHSASNSRFLTPSNNRPLIISLRLEVLSGHVLQNCHHDLGSGRHAFQQLLLTALRCHLGGNCYVLHECLLCPAYLDGQSTAARCAHQAKAQSGPEGPNTKGSQ